MSPNGSVHTYTTDATKNAEEVLGWELKSARTIDEPDASSTFGIRACFYNPTLQRRDLDNLLKLLCDAANGVIWADDTQVAEIHAKMERGSADARSDIVIYRIGAVVTRTAKCGHCKRAYKTYPSWLHKNYCSRTCSLKANATGTIMPCFQCKATRYLSPYRLKGITHHFCSHACRSAYGSRVTTCPMCQKEFRIAISRRSATREFCTRDCAIGFFRALELKRVRGACERCGAWVVRKEHRFCRACKIEMNPNPTSNYWARTPAPV